MLTAAPEIAFTDGAVAGCNIANLVAPKCCGEPMNVWTRRFGWENNKAKEATSITPRRAASTLFISRSTSSLLVSSFGCLSRAEPSRAVERKELRVLRCYTPSRRGAQSERSEAAARSEDGLQESIRRRVAS
ncbi:hypothetical protein MRX96_017940 [Rhipicephalus microplus]